MAELSLLPQLGQLVVDRLLLVDQTTLLAGQPFLDAVQVRLAKVDLQQKFSLRSFVELNP